MGGGGGGGGGGGKGSIWSIKIPCFSGYLVEASPWLGFDFGSSRSLENALLSILSASVHQWKYDWFRSFF